MFEVIQERVRKERKSSPERLGLPWTKTGVHRVARFEHKFVALLSLRKQQEYGSFRWFEGAGLSYRNTSTFEKGDDADKLSFRWVWPLSYNVQRTQLASV